MAPHQSLQRSYLFTIRVWTEPLAGGQVARRGQAQYVLTGERCAFRDWITLVAYLDEKIRELDSGTGEAPEGSPGEAPEGSEASG